MFTAIKGYYEKGRIILTEPPPVTDKTNVIITFLSEDSKTLGSGKRTLGILKGQINVSDDFDEPLDDFFKF
jgi:hypothetical protein